MKRINMRFAQMNEPKEGNGAGTETAPTTDATGSEEVNSEEGTEEEDPGE